MSKFNPQAFRATLEKEATDKHIKFEYFLTMMRREFNHRRLDKKLCLRLLDLLGNEVSLSVATLTHIEKCSFCSMLVKISWFQCASDDEKVEAVQRFMNMSKMTREYFEAKLCDESAAEAGSPHLGYIEMVCFHAIPPSRRKHREICKQCDLNMIMFATIPLPDLS